MLFFIRVLFGVWFTNFEQAGQMFSASQFQYAQATGTGNPAHVIAIETVEFFKINLQEAIEIFGDIFSKAKYIFARIFNYNIYFLLLYISNYF